MQCRVRPYVDGQRGNVTFSTILHDNSLISQTLGRVGISTDNPSANLTVVGNALITSNLSVTGLSNISANVNNTWTVRTSADDIAWRAVAYGNQTFVAVANSGTGSRAMTSPDGVVWTLRATAADNQWVGLAYGNGLFVAVAISGTGSRVMTSPDGISWTIRTSAADLAWRSVTWGSDKFVAVASTGTGNRVMTSSDGVVWTTRTSAADNNWQSVAWGNGVYVAVADTGTGNRVMTSNDGILWTSRTSAVDNNWAGVTWGGIGGGGLFVAVAISGTGDRVMTSPDGVTWTSRTSAADNNWYGVTWGYNVFVAVSNNGTGNRVMISTDGVAWKTGTSAANNSWRAVAYGDGTFAAVAESGTGTRAMSWYLPTKNVMYYNGDSGHLSHGPMDVYAARVGSLIVLGDATFDTNVLRVDSGNNRVDILDLTTTGNASLVTIDVKGNTTANILIANVLSGTTLSVTGNVQAGNLSTNAISGMAGTLSQTLGVAGNVLAGNLSTNAISGTAVTLSQTLSVTGNVRAGNLSTNAISGTAGTLSQTLSVAGNVQAGNLSTGTMTADVLAVTGNNHIFDSTAIITVSRTISANTVNSGIVLGSIGTGPSLNSGYNNIYVEIRVNQAKDGNNTISKAYSVPFSGLFDTGGLKRLLPTASTYIRPNDIGIEARSVDNPPLQNGFLELRLVRTKVDPATVDTTMPIQVSMTVHFHKQSGWSYANGWIPSTQTYTSTLNPSASTDYFPGTTLMQTPYGLAVNTDNPLQNFALDVNGASNFRGPAIITGVLAVTENVSAACVVATTANVSNLILQGTASGAGVTQSVTDGSNALVTSNGVFRYVQATLSQTLSVSGNVLAGNLSTNAISGTTGTLSQTLSVTGNVRAGNLSTNAISGTAGTLSQTLSVAGNVQAGNLSTNAITTATLHATGDVTVNGSTFRIDATNNRVGVAQSSPAYPLDVTGDINATGVLRVGGAEVLSGTTVGSGITSSSLTTVGVLGNLTTNVAGTATLGSTVIRTFQKALATGLGNVSEICTITGSNLTFAGHLYVVQAETGKACLTYSLCVSAQNGSGGTTNGAWHRLLPISAMSTPSLFGVAAEINVDTEVNGQCKIRLVRAAGAGTSANFECVLVLQQSRGTRTITITDSAVTASGQTLATVFFKGTALTQVNGNVGIGIESPTSLLTVAGTANVQPAVGLGLPSLESRVKYMMSVA